MNPTVRLILAVVAGFVVGGGVNMGLLTVGGGVIPAPPGVDMTTPEGLAAGMPLLQPKHFLFPFLAHALGTFVGALVAVLLAAGRPSRPAWIVGVLFLLGGIAACFMIPAPLWFEALDLVLAYLPMAWLAQKLVARRTGGAADAT